MAVARHDLDEAHILMRVGIIRLNADASSDSRAFITTHALGRDTPLRYYSKERLMSVEARASFVAPDLAQLP